MPYKQWLLTLMIALLIALQLPTAADDESANLKLYINDQLVHLSAPIRVIKGVPMLPMREFFEKLGADVRWFEATREVTAYQSNMQIKLTIDRQLAYRNGNAYRLKHTPVIVDGLTFIPVQFTAESFHMHYRRSGDRIDLTKRNISKNYLLHFIEYSTVTINDYDMTLAIPYGWVKLDERSYGIKDDYDDYNFTVSRLADRKGQSKSQVVEALKAELTARYSGVVSFTYQAPVYDDDFTFLSFGYFYNGINQTRIIDTYVLTHDDDVYVFQGSSDANGDISYLRSIYADILDKVQFRQRSIETSDEHYYEYPAFFEAGIALKQPIASNIEVDNYVNFNGTLSKNAGFTSLYAVVAKRKEQTTFDIEIAENDEFNSKIYTPFGLGKHNIAIYGRRRDGDTVLLMRFSALNLSNDVTRYLIPSQYVQSNRTEAVSLSGYLSYQLTNTYSVAKSIYNYLLEDISLENLTLKGLENLRTSTDVIIGNRANPLELSITMTALLRASDIPAKVVMGKIDGQAYYACEAKINGVWVVYDPVTAKRVAATAESSKQDDARATPQFYFSKHYYLSLKEYINLFDNYQVLNY